jgi:hypothetical protein
MKNAREWLRSNQGLGFILTLLLVAFLVHLELSPWVHREMRDGFTLGFFPVLGVVLLIIFSVIMIFDRQRKETPGGFKSFTFKSFLGGVIIIMATWSYFTVMRKVGFLIVTPIYLLFFIYALGLKSWRTCAISAAVMTVIVYGAFTGIGIKLPPGILWGILPF